MNRIIALLITWTILINSGLAAESATLVEKGDIVPFTGTLITNERVDKLVKAEKKVLTLEMLRGNLEEQISFHKEDAKNSRKRLTEAKFDAFTNVLGSFLLGCILTSVAFKINQEIQR